LTVSGIPFFTRTDIRLDALLWGCSAALLWEIPFWRGFLCGLLGSWRWLLIVLLYGLLITLKPPLALAGQAFLMPLLILGTVARPGRLTGLLLEQPVLKWIGRLSYSLYLWQQLFLVPAHEGSLSWLGYLQVWPLNLAATLGCAAASYYLIERPMIRIGHHLADRFPKLGGGAAGDVTHRFQCPAAV
jgi:peptidoglycan/LPS O-acetylase OafA/YrhL